MSLDLQNPLVESLFPKRGRILPKAASTCISSVASYVKVVTTQPSYMNSVKHSCRRSGLIGAIFYLVDIV